MFRTKSELNIIFMLETLLEFVKDMKSMKKIQIQNL